MIELACREAVFHFNKHYLVDPTVPMWVIKTKGKTYMVNHVDSQINWSTKETPDNSHTKGAIKFKNALVTIDDENCATLTPLKMADIARLKAKSYTRILITWKDKVMSFLHDQNMQTRKHRGKPCVLLPQRRGRNAAQMPNLAQLRHKRPDEMEA